LCLALFLLQERRAPEPLLPLRLFKNSVFTITSAAGFIVGLGLFGGIVFLPLFLQVVIGASATNSGLLLLPLMAGVITTSIASGRVITRTGRYKRYPVVGTAMMGVGLLLLSTMNPSTPLPMASLYMLMLGAGVGLVMQVLVVAVQNAVDARDLGVATSLNTFFRSLGGSFGTALFGAILSSRLAFHLTRLLPGGIDGQPVTGIAASPAAVAQLPPEVQGPVIEAFSHSITTVFAAAIPFAVIAFLLAIALPEKPLRDTAHVGGAPREAETAVVMAGD
jgi:predicted MFS family arabinose efflux permease